MYSKMSKSGVVDIPVRSLGRGRRPLGRLNRDLTECPSLPIGTPTPSLTFGGTSVDSGAGVRVPGRFGSTVVSRTRARLVGGSGRPAWYDQDWSIGCAPTGSQDRCPGLRPEPRGTTRRALGTPTQLRSQGEFGFSALETRRDS